MLMSKIKLKQKRNKINENLRYDVNLGTDANKNYVKNILEKKMLNWTGELTLISYNNLWYNGSAIIFVLFNVCGYSLYNKKFNHISIDKFESLN